MRTVVEPRLCRDTRVTRRLLALVLVAMVFGCSGTEEPVTGGAADLPELPTDVAAAGDALVDDDATDPAGCDGQLNATPCDDGNACTENDACQGGVCFGGSVPCDDGDACTTDACDPDAGCQNTPVDDGEPCSDGNPCTVADACQQGTCAGVAKDCPDDGNACTTFSGCEGANATCVYASVNDGASCQDDNACTEGDKCQEGQCNSGSPKHCDDGNECTIDSCNPKQGCKFTPPTDSAKSCDDGDGCTVNDVCKAGACAGTALDCNDENKCTDDKCVPGTGCSYTYNNIPCQDGNPCTLEDSCVDGQCLSTMKKSCDDSDPCTTEFCDLADGICKFEYNDAACDDGDECTEGESCTNGNCFGGTQLVCDDGDKCTDDACVAGLGCVFAVVETECDDGDDCTLGDTCVDGECVGDEDDCEDGNPCTVDNCDSDAGCGHAPVSGSCDDGNACTTGDLCTQGACAGTSVECDDDNPCTDDGCDSATGCTATANAADCDDADSCTEADKCADGSCMGSSVQCDDNNACTDDTCTKAGGCLHTYNAATCDDGDACTEGDACEAGTCSPGASKVCDDGNPCTTNTCLPAEGCTTAPNLEPCSDGGKCTSDGQCQGSVCVGQPKSCDDGISCTVDSCNPLVGCSHEAHDASCEDENPCTTDTCLSSQGCTSTLNAALCSDDNACTSGDQCTGGLCIGQPVVCEDGVNCTVDSCESSIGCVSEALDSLCDDGNPCTAGTCTASDGGCVQQAAVKACDDDDQCTVGDFCQQGGCQPGTGIKECDDADKCTVDTCAPSTGCGHATITCDDHDPCTTDGCLAAVGCFHAAINCSDGDACTVDTCDTSGECIHTAIACADADPCTDDICAGGACTHPPSSCNDDDECTVDDCHYSQGCQHVVADCDDGDQCTDDSCAVETGCVHSATPDCCGNGLVEVGETCDEKDSPACKSDQCATSASTLWPTVGGGGHVVACGRSGTCGLGSFDAAGDGECGSEGIFSVRRLTPGGRVGGAGWALGSKSALALGFDDQTGGVVIRPSAANSKQLELVTIGDEQPGSSATPLHTNDSTFGGGANIVALLRATGSYWVAWRQVYASGAEDLRVRRFSLSGGPLGGTQAVAASTNVDQRTDLFLAHTPATGVCLFWRQEAADNSAASVWRACLGELGQASGAAVMVTSLPGPGVVDFYSASSVSGNRVVLLGWGAGALSDGDELGIRAFVVGAAGDLVGQYQVNSKITGNQTDPVGFESAPGDLTVFWQHSSNVGKQVLERVLRIDSGAALTDERVIYDGADGDSIGLKLEVSERGNGWLVFRAEGPPQTVRTYAVRTRCYADDPCVIGNPEESGGCSLSAATPGQACVTEQADCVSGRTCTEEQSCAGGVAEPDGISCKPDGAATLDAGDCVSGACVGAPAPCPVDTACTEWAWSPVDGCQLSTKCCGNGDVDPGEECDEGVDSPWCVGCEAVSLDVCSGGECSSNVKYTDSILSTDGTWHVAWSTSSDAWRLAVDLEAASWSPTKLTGNVSDSASGHGKIVLADLPQFEGGQSYVDAFLYQGDAAKWTLGSSGTVGPSAQGGSITCPKSGAHRVCYLTSNGVGGITNRVVLTGYLEADAVGEALVGVHVARDVAIRHDGFLAGSTLFDGKTWLTFADLSGATPKLVAQGIVSGAVGEPKVAQAIAWTAQDELLAVRFNCQNGACPGYECNACTLVTSGDAGQYGFECAPFEAGAVPSHGTPEVIRMVQLPDGRTALVAMAESVLTPARLVIAAEATPDGIGPARLVGSLPAGANLIGAHAWKDEWLAVAHRTQGRLELVRYSLDRVQSILCQGDACPKECVPDCAGKNCGSDGCGGSCGACPTGACDNDSCPEPQPSQMTLTVHLGFGSGVYGTQVWLAYPAAKVDEASFAVTKLGPVTGSFTSQNASNGAASVASIVQDPIAGPADIYEITFGILDGQSPDASEFALTQSKASDQTGNALPVEFTLTVEVQ